KGRRTPADGGSGDRVDIGSNDPEESLPRGYHREYDYCGGCVRRGNEQMDDKQGTDERADEKFGWDNAAGLALLAGTLVWIVRGFRSKKEQRDWPSTMGNLGLPAEDFIQELEKQTPPQKGINDAERFIGILKAHGRRKAEEALLGPPPEVAERL